MFVWNERTGDTDRCRGLDRQGARADARMPARPAGRLANPRRRTPPLCLAGWNSATGDDSPQNHVFDLLWRLARSIAGTPLRALPRRIRNGIPPHPFRRAMLLVAQRVAWNASTTPLGIRPRSETSWPFFFAHSRIAWF